MSFEEKVSDVLIIILSNILIFKSILIDNLQLKLFQLLSIIQLIESQIQFKLICINNYHDYFINKAFLEISLYEKYFAASIEFFFKVL
ncbi:hypothetical protein C8J95_107106 [Elizabethkingia sp. YR214]|nr:hypothetical protein C8J95_107106 [Elizabethkingia sp. YR214]